MIYMHTFVTYIYIQRPKICGKSPAEDVTILTLPRLSEGPARGPGGFTFRHVSTLRSLGLHQKGMAFRGAEVTSDLLYKEFSLGVFKELVFLYFFHIYK